MLSLGKEVALNYTIEMENCSNRKHLQMNLYIHVIQLFTTQSRLLTTLKRKAYENIVGKGENAGNQHFLLFPQCFLLIP